MTTVFYIADLHLGHGKTCAGFKGTADKPGTPFTKVDGVTPLRPYDDHEHMREELIANWNGVVRPADTVYVLGDVAIRRQELVHLSRMHGRKILIRGNHDIFKINDYLPYFADVRGMFINPAREGVCTHAPIHPQCVDRFKFNIHGHMHDVTIPDHRYVNVCVERINFTPISHEEVLAVYAKQSEGASQ